MGEFKLENMELVLTFDSKFYEMLIFVYLEFFIIVLILLVEFSFYVFV